MCRLKHLLVTLTIVALVMTACPPPAPEAPVAPAEPLTDDEREPVTLRFWHHWGGGRVPLMEEQIRRFEETFPWITVDTTLQPWELRLEKLLTSVAAGDPPDVTMLGRQDVPAFAAQNALIPLDEWMERDGITGDLFYEAEFLGAQFDGRTWILPLPTGGALNLFWHNKDLAREAGLDPDNPPQNWDELEEWGRALTIAENGQIQQVGINVLSTGGHPPNFLVWLYNNGGTWISDDLRTIQFGGPEGLETLEWMVNFTNEINLGIEELQGYYAGFGDVEAHPFYNSAEALTYEGSWAWFLLQEVNPDMDVGVSVIPHGPRGESGGVAYGGWGYVIPRNAAHPEEAWLLVKWLTTEMDGACWFLQEQARPSPLRACNEDPRSGEGNPLWDDIIDAMSRDRWVPVTPVQPQIEQVLEQMVEEAAFGLRTPAEALEWAAQESQRILDEYWEEHG